MILKNDNCRLGARKEAGTERRKALYAKDFFDRRYSLYDVCTGLVRTTLRRPYGSRGLARDRELPSVDCVVAAIHSRCGNRKQVDDEWLLSETVRDPTSFRVSRRCRCLLQRFHFRGPEKSP